MRLGCDLDGVLANLHGAFVATALELFPDLDRAALEAPTVGASPPAGAPVDGADAPPPPVESEFAVSPRQTDAVWRRLSGLKNFWETLDEIETGAIARLAAFVEDRRWEVLFITSRPPAEGRTVQRQSQRWLERHGFPLPSVYVVYGSRGRIAEALDLDVVIDDRPENCLDVVLESRAGAVLVWRGGQGNVPASAQRLGITVAPGVLQSFDMLAEAERARDGSVVERLRRLFGFRPGPNALLRR